MKSDQPSSPVAIVRHWLTPWRAGALILGAIILFGGFGKIAFQASRLDDLSRQQQQQLEAVNALKQEIERLQLAQTATAVQAVPARADQTGVVNGFDTLRDDITTLNESVTAIQEQLDARLTALEQRVDSFSARPPAPGLAASKQGADVKALAEFVRLLADRIDDLSKPAAAAAKTGTHQENTVPAAAVVTATAGADLARLEQSAITAFKTLDQQFQVILERLDELTAKDQAFEQAQEAARVALQTELEQWRDQRSPPLWDMAARLSGVTIRFSESTSLTDGAGAQAAMEQVSDLVLGADPAIGVRIVGYADFDGTDPESNRITSQKRAEFILDQLTRLGVPKERLLAVGRSTEDRVIDSDAAGNGNRRAIFEPFLLKDV